MRLERSHCEVRTFLVLYTFCIFLCCFFPVAWRDKNARLFLRFYMLIQMLIICRFCGVWIWKNIYWFYMDSVMKKQSEKSSSHYPFKVVFSTWKKCRSRTRFTRFFCLLFVGQKECKLMGLIKFSRKKILHSKFIIVTLHSEMDDWCWRLVAIKAIFHHPISAATHSAKL